MECVLRFIDAGFLAARISKKSSIFCAPSCAKTSLLWGEFVPKLIQRVSSEQKTSLLRLQKRG